MLIRATIVYYKFCEKSYKERKETKTNKYRRYKIKDIYLKTRNGYAKANGFHTSFNKKKKNKTNKENKKLRPTIAFIKLKVLLDQS